MAKITLVGMYNFDNTLFDDMDLPEGIDKEVFISSLLLRDGEFEVLYPEATFLKTAIAMWSKKWRRTFERWLVGLDAEWNPIENYDRYEEWEDTHNEEGSSESKGNVKGKDDFTSTGANEALKSAYDSASYSPDAKTVADNHNVSNSESNTSANASDKREGNSTHKAHIHGNIGVTTSASMFSEYMSVNEWNLYEHMADLFKTELLIPIY